MASLKKISIGLSDFPRKKNPLMDPTTGLVLLYNPFSAGGREIVKSLGAAKINGGEIQVQFSYLNGGARWDLETASRIKKPFVINWGYEGSHPDTFAGYVRKYTDKLINPMPAVAICGNKVRFFTTMRNAADGPRIPEFTTNVEEAKGWATEGAAVLGRKSRGSAGRDIVFFADDPERFLDSDFWSKYKKKKKEYRVHIFNGEVLFIQQKALPKEDPEGNTIPRDKVDFRIRTHRTGFIFKRNDVVVPDDVVLQAKKAFKSVPDLTFGAIDVIWNQSEAKAYVLEINTAPGLEGTSITEYASAFKKHLGLPTA